MVAEFDECREADWSLRFQTLVTKLPLGHALVWEALLPQGATGSARSLTSHADEAELRRQGHSEVQLRNEGANSCI